MIVIKKKKKFGKNWKIMGNKNKYNEKCLSCIKTCKQWNFVTVVYCPSYQKDPEFKEPKFEEKTLTKYKKPKNLNDIIWKKLRSKVKFRDKYLCQRCGTGKNLTIHHIVPIKDGGKNEMRNLITLCLSCHNIVEKEEIQEWNKIKKIKKKHFKRKKKKKTTISINI